MTLRAVFFAMAGLAFATAADPALAQSLNVYSRGNGLVNDSAYALDRKNYNMGTLFAEQALQSGDVSIDNMPAAYNNLCIGLTGLRKFEEAVQACDKAVQLKPRSWEFYNNRANIYFFLGQFDHALAEYYKAMTFSTVSGVLISNIEITLRYRKQFGTRPGSAVTERSS